MTGWGISKQRGEWTAIIVILLVAIASRCVLYGNPVADMDDQFYWLVGRSWWDGSWPIIDIWDRKPVGLFVIYGAIAGISRSYLAIQITATLFAFATALIVRRIALLAVGNRPALLAALLYLLYIVPFGGGSGQSPVFYNLFMAAAGYLFLSSFNVSETRPILCKAFAAMLLCGLAMVVKQVSMAEGVYFGLGFLWLLRRSGATTYSLLMAGAAMIALALLPTLAGFALFAVKGSAAVHDYLDAAYLSIFEKGATSVWAHASGLLYLLLFGAPLIFVGLFGAIRLDSLGRRPFAPALIGWIAAAMVGYVMVPNFFSHYFLPVIVPLSIAAAGAFDRPGPWPLFGAVAFYAALGGSMFSLSTNRNERVAYDSAVRAIRGSVGGGCLFVANGPVSLYAVAPRCGSGNVVFPYHLTLSTEGSAVPVPQAAQVERYLAAQPAVIVTQDSERDRQAPSVRDLLDRELARNYRPIWRAPAGLRLQLNTLTVWRRRDVNTPNR